MFEFSQEKNQKVSETYTIYRAGTNTSCANGAIIMYVCTHQLLTLEKIERCNFITVYLAVKKFNGYRQQARFNYLAYLILHTPQITQLFLV